MIDSIAPIVFLFGLLIGSFLNVCIYRLPEEKSIVTPPSSCPVCAHRLRAVDLIPVFSYLLLRGRCRDCGAPISSRYPLVELLTGALFLWCYRELGLTPQLVGGLVFVSFMVLISFIDYDHQIILDGSLVLLAGCGLAYNLAVGPLEIWSMFAGGLAGGVLLLLLAIISRGGMGGGDVKFAAALGFWLGWPYTLLALFAGFLIGGVVSSLLLLLRIKKRKDYIPFGPFIAIGAFLTWFYGQVAVIWYLGFFN